MKVSAQYAQEHFADILAAIDTGEEVKLTFPGDLLIQEASSPGAHL
jgi:antitoxin (DNA-binding transcriptional repressor) of toxin-antitoxin stability system